MNSSRVRVADRNQRSIVYDTDPGGLRPYAFVNSQSRVRRTSGVISHQRCTPPGSQSILPFHSLTLNPSWPSVKGSGPKGVSGSETVLPSASETELNFYLSRWTSIDKSLCPRPKTCGLSCPGRKFGCSGAP